MFPPDFLAAAEAVLGACRARGWQVTTAESCTGGLIAGLLTAIGGSSDVVDGGAVTYSNAAKTRMLGVPAALIAAHGAVSEEVARAMAEGARRAGRRNGGEAGGSGVVRVGITGRRRHAVAHFPG
jgi:nicotinamide-nucleotide amidase